jgi:nicotinamidase/pyrazinamidase
MLRPGDAVIVVDVQRDFCPGGALPIENGDAVIPVLNAWIAEAVEQHVPVFDAFEL